MTDLLDNVDDDESIVQVTSSLCDDDDIETTYSFVMPQKFILPGMSESQQLSDSPHKQLQDILKENNALRDSLQKNNTDMRQLLASFREFQDKTLQSRNIHKQKIDSIWRDNQKLQDEKDKLFQQCQGLHGKILEYSQQVQKIQEELSNSQKSCSDYENQLKEVKEELKRSELMVLTTVSQVKELEAEVAVMKLEREKISNQNEALVQQLQRQSEALNEQLEAANLRKETSENALALLKEDQQEQQSQLLKLNGELEKLTNQNQALLEQLEAANAAAMEHINSPDLEEMGFSYVQRNLSTIPDLNTQHKLTETELRCSQLTQIVESQKQQLEKLEKEQETWKQMTTGNQTAERFFHVETPENLTSKILEECGERCESVSQQLGACEERLQVLKLDESSSSFQDGLKHEIKLLKQLLEQEKQDKANEKKALEERLQKLTDNYRQIIASWEIYENEQKTKGRQCEALTAFEKRQHQEKLDELMAKNVALEEETQEKERELNNLKGQVSLLNRETEHVPILRAQAEVYRQDFSRERDEKTKAETMVVILKQDVASLQAQVGELRDELNVYQEQQRRELNYHQEQQRHENLEEPRGEEASSSRSREEEPPVQLRPPPPVEEFVMPRSKKVIIQNNRHSDSDYESRRGRRHHHRRSSSPQPDSLSDVLNGRNLFECPRCRMTYNTVTAVENHLEGCLREDGPYP